jgi:hypothetical protein
MKVIALDRTNNMITAEPIHVHIRERTPEEKGARPIPFSLPHRGANRKGQQRGTPRWFEAIK